MKRLKEFTVKLNTETVQKMKTNPPANDSRQTCSFVALCVDGDKLQSIGDRNNCACILTTNNDQLEILFAVSIKIKRCLPPDG